MEKLLAGVAVVVAIGACVIALNAQGIQGVQGDRGPRGEQGVAGQDGIDGVNGRNGKDASNFGAVTGPDSYFQTETHNGVRYDFVRQALIPASSTLCAIKTPSASSTIVSATANIASGNTYANDYQLGWGLTAGATTTNLARLTLAAGASNAAIATTTLTSSIGGGVDGVVPPNTYINFRVSTSSASATFIPVGACNVTFRGI